MRSATCARVLQKGRAYAIDKGIEPAVLLDSRLIADMFPLIRQVQIAHRHGHARQRLSSRRGARVLPDTETDFAGLYARIDRACEVVRGYAAAQIDGSEGRAIPTMPRRGRDRCAWTGSPTCSISAAEPVLPCLHRLRDPARGRDGAGQGRFLGD